MTAEEVEGANAVEAWLVDLNNPVPDAPSLAAFVARQAKNERDALLRMANVVLTLDATLKGCREANKALREERDKFAKRYIDRHGAVQDLAHTATIMIDRIAQLDEVVKAAVAVRQGKGTQEAFDDAVTVYIKILEARS